MSQWDPEELRTNSPDKKYMVRFLPYSELADGSSTEPIIGYPNPNKGYGYEYWEEFFLVLSNAEERMKFLISSGAVETIEIAFYFRASSMKHRILAQWNDK